MIDQDEEDKDLEIQAGRDFSSPEEEKGEARAEREQTPGPEPTVQSPEALKTTPSTNQPPKENGTTSASDKSQTATKPASDEPLQAQGGATD